MSTRIAFLGPAGSYAEQAAMNHNAAATLVPFPSIPSAASSVPDGEADEAVVPIENSLEGSVNQPLDILVDRTGLFIRHELVLPIDHCLMTRPGSPTDAFEVIFSHPQALAQCRRFLQERSMSDRSAGQVAIVDYGMGNLFSVMQACDRAGLRAVRRRWSDDTKGGNAAGAKANSA